VSLYELAVLGRASQAERDRLTETIKEMTKDFGLTIGRDLVIHDAGGVATRNRRAAFAAAYFGGDPAADAAAVDELLRTSAVIIPTVSSGGSFDTDIPEKLRSANGHRRRAIDTEMNELAAALLECLGLLNVQRRVFISYRRTEARAAAMQLYDRLAERTFDVFLDTHDIRPGKPFQEVLFHRLCDSDVLLMLDTPTYFQRMWTRQELGRALAKGIHILRVVWPKPHEPTPEASLAETIQLAAAEMGGADGPIPQARVDEIALALERTRSRSIAARYMAITGKLREDLVRIGGSVDAIGSHRAIAITLPSKTKVWAYPVVGFPSAELLYDVADKAANSDQVGTPILVYDEVGMSQPWIAHLKWLDENIKSVRAIKTSTIGYDLVAL
jgi:TIR domain